MYTYFIFNTNFLSSAQEVATPYFQLIATIFSFSYDKEPEGNPPLSCSLDIFCGHDESLDVVNYVDGDYITYSKLATCN